jgi:recombination protein RecA
VARIKIVKNKVAPPFKTAQVDIMFNEGISKMGDLIETATKMDIIQKSGAFYSYTGTKLGQGKQKSVTFLKSNPDLASEIEKLVREKANGEISKE